MTVVHGLDATGRQPGCALPWASMHDIAGGFVVVADLDRLLPPGGDADGLRQVLLLATGAFEAWLVEWPVGAELGAHDHGASSTVVHVRSGVLAERRRGPRRGPTSGWRRLGPGCSTTLAPGGRHTLHNIGRTPALSVHVYSPPTGSRTSGAGAAAS
ncbi:MAG: cupin domain-containing protein [Acidimicrobiales bacterium]